MNTKKFLFIKIIAEKISFAYWAIKCFAGVVAQMKRVSVKLLLFKNKSKNEIIPAKIESFRVFKWVNDFTIAINIEQIYIRIDMYAKSRNLNIEMLKNSNVFIKNFSTVKT